MDLLHHLRHLEEQLLDPAVRHDGERLSQLLAPAFREFGSSGRTFTRPEIIEALALEQPATTPALTLSGFAIVASDSSWALVTYRSHRRNLSGDLEATTLRSSTWILRDDRWQMLFHQGTTEFTGRSDPPA